MKEYPNKLYHRVPPWVEPSSVFHIRIRSAFADKRQLVESDLASRIIESVDYYTKRQKWFHHLFVIMPDHIHALLSFSRERSVSQVIGEWKRYHSRVNNVIWQDNYFDHRIRNVDSLIEKASYIRMNPVRAGLCQAPEEWLWVVDQKDSMNN